MNWVERQGILYLEDETTLYAKIRRMPRQEKHDYIVIEIEGTLGLHEFEYNASMESYKRKAAELALVNVLDCLDEKLKDCYELQKQARELLKLSTA